MAAHKFHHSRHHCLSNEARRSSLPVERVLEVLEPLAGLTVVDIGCGKGYFAIPVAEAVGREGKVYAVDTSEEMLAMLKEEAAGVPNLIPVLSQETVIPLEDGIADIIFASTVYHEFEDRPAMLSEMRRLARRGARHVVIDWNQRSDEHGPPMEHRVPASMVVAEYLDTGLVLRHRFEPGPDFYGLIFR